jgi:putative zinc finger protein
MGYVGGVARPPAWNLLTTAISGPLPQPICQTVVVDEMVCAELVERVTEYLEGTLHEQDLLRLNRHLAACDSCESYVAQVKAAIRIAGALPGEELDPDTEAGIVKIYRSWVAERDKDR